MNLNKENVKKILGIITFTLVLLALLLNLGAVKTQLMFVWGIVFPFALGGAIAFILNIPMTAIEKQAKRMKIKEKLIRPISMVLSILFVFAIVTVVLVVVIPQLGKTVDSISKGMSSFFPKAQAWLEGIFADNQEIVR